MAGVRPKLTTEDRITKAKIVMLKLYPFWAYLVMHMECVEDKTGLIPTAGVKMNSKYIYYNAEFIDSLDDDELIGLLCHEVMHVAFEHPNRCRKRDPNRWNIATDVWINGTLQAESITLPKCGLLPSNDEYTFTDGKTLDTITKRFAEEVYTHVPEGEGGSGGSGGGQGQEDSKNPGFDDHGQWGDDDGEDDGVGGTRSEIDWPKVMAEAAQAAKAQGKAPAGVDRWVEVMSGRMLDWRSILYSAIVTMIPHDYTFARPSRRSINAGMYLPSTKKENMELAWIEDTSGSMSARDIGEGRAMLADIIRMFENVKVWVVDCDAGVHGEPYELTERNVASFLAAPMQGGGGTDFRPAFDYMVEHFPHLKMMVYYTDGYGTFPPENDFNFRTVWLLQPQHCDESDVPFGQVLPLGRYPLPDQV